MQSGCHTVWQAILDTLETSANSSLLLIKALITDKGFDFDISAINIPIKIIETDPTEAGYTENPPFYWITGEGKVIQKAPRGPGYYWQQALKD